MTALLRAFQEVVASGQAGRVTYDTSELAETLASLYARGRAAYPKLEVSERTFGHRIARVMDSDRACALEKVAAEDVYLACACVEGARGAAATFEAQYLKVIRRAISRPVASPGDREDAEQRTLQHLLVGSGGAGPAIAKYPGHVPLTAWIPVVAIRVAVSLHRAESAEHRLREKAGADAIAVNPEHLYIREELRRAVEPAVEAALRRLDDRDRLILRLFLVSGMTLTAIGESLGLSQQAVSKRIANTRNALMKDVRGAVAGTLRISEDEFSSILRFVASQLDVNVSRSLKAK